MLCTDIDQFIDLHSVLSHPNRWWHQRCSAKFFISRGPDRGVLFSIVDHPSESLQSQTGQLAIDSNLSIAI